MMEPYLLVGSEIVAITERQLSRLTKLSAFRIARDTYACILKMDSGERLAWYELGVLTEVDAYQDRFVMDRLYKGLQLLSERYPLTMKKAKRQAEKNDSGTTGRATSRRK